MADVQFIATSVGEILRDCKPEQIKVIVGYANKYATVLKFPEDRELWSSDQVDKYLTFIEKSSTLPDLTEEDDIVDRIQSIMGPVTIKEDGGDNPLSGTVDKVVSELEERKKFRDDLKCPYCKALVYDNRNNKKSDKSPDFVCSTNDAAICGGHTGKWRKSWWLDNSDIPDEWGINEKEIL